MVVASYTSTGPPGTSWGRALGCAAAVRLHDRVTALVPARLRWAGRELRVRADLVVARPGELPPLAEVRVDVAAPVR